MFYYDENGNLQPEDVEGFRKWILNCRNVKHLKVLNEDILMNKIYQFFPEVKRSTIYGQFLMIYRTEFNYDEDEVFNMFLKEIIRYKRSNINISYEQMIDYLVKKPILNNANNF